MYQLLVSLGRNAGILQLARILAGRVSLTTGAKSFVSRGIFSPATGVLSSVIQRMPRAKAMELMQLAGELAMQYNLLQRRGYADMPLPTHLSGDMHYLKLKEVLEQSNPLLEKVTPLVNPLLTATGYGAPVAGVLSLATEASRKASKGETIGIKSLWPFKLADGVYDIAYARGSQAQLESTVRNLEQRIAEQQRRIEQRRKERAAHVQSRELERTLSAQQTAALASRPVEVEVQTVPTEFGPEEGIEQDVHYFFGSSKKKKGKKKKKRAAARAEAEEQITAMKEELRGLQEQERTEAEEAQQAEHQATLERVMRTTGGALPAESEEAMGFAAGDFGGQFDYDCCCLKDYSLVETSPASLTGTRFPKYYDAGSRVLYVPGHNGTHLKDRLRRYNRWARNTGQPTPGDLLADIVYNTTLEDCGCCHDEHDYDCNCCSKDTELDAAFARSGRLPSGPFFSSSWVEASLGDLPEGTYGMVDTGKRPFRVTINRNVDLPRAQVSFAHEMLHVMNDLHKLGLPHDQLHNAAIMLVGEVLPGLLELTRLAK